MPLYLRLVDPVQVGRSAQGAPALVGSQEEAANRALANIIRQLASLGKHANDIFECLECEAGQLAERTGRLSGRVKVLENKLEARGNPTFSTNLDVENPYAIGASDNEHGGGGGGGSGFAEEWHSNFQQDSGLFTPESRPKCVQELYTKCEPVPSLQNLQPYRDDEQYCQKLYSNPEMFFDAWKSEMLKTAKTNRLKRRETKKRRHKQGSAGQGRKKVQVEKIITAREKIIQREADAGNVTLTRKNRPKKEVSIEKQPSVISGPPSHLTPDYADEDDEFDPKYFPEVSMDILREKEAKKIPNESRFSEGLPSMPAEASFDLDRDSMFPPPPDELLHGAGPAVAIPDPDYYEESPSGQTPATPVTPIRTAPPPPPFPGSAASAGAAPPPPPSPPPPPPLSTPSHGAGPQAPVPPPPPALGASQMPPKDSAIPQPPPPPPMPSSEDDGRSNLLKQIQAGKALKKVEVQAKPVDERSDLLRQIREGKQLKKVQINDNRTKKEQPRNMNTVADILAFAIDQRHGPIQGSSDSESDDSDSLFEDCDFSD